MPSYVPAKKNTELIFYIGLVSQSTGQFQANATLAAGDVKVATDDGAPANISTLPTVDADFTKRIKVTLSATEMNGDNVTVIFSDAAGDEWDDVIINIQTSTKQIDDLSTLTAAQVNTEADTALSDYGALKPTVAGRTLDVTAGGEAGIDWSNIGQSGNVQNLSQTTISVVTNRVSANVDRVDGVALASHPAGVFPADAQAISGDATAADNFETMLDGTGGSVLSLKQLNIVNSAGDALRAVSLGGNGNGGYFEGHGTGYGVDILGGSNNVGLQIDGGSAAGAAVVFNSHAPNFPAMTILSDDGPGIYAEGVNGNGIEIFGSTASISAPQGIIGSDSEDLSVTNITDAVWDEATSGHTTAGTTGKALTDAGSAGDPWGTALPGAYSAGTAGQIVGDNLNATVSSRATQTSVDDLPTNAELATALDAIPTAAENAAEVLSAATANPIDANVQEINDVTLTGDGSGTPWGPA